jgi:hypothetical protein
MSRAYDAVRALAYRRGLRFCYRARKVTLFAECFRGTVEQAREFMRSGRYDRAEPAPRAPAAVLQTIADNPVGATRSEPVMPLPSVDLEHPLPDPGFVAVDRITLPDRASVALVPVKLHTPAPSRQKAPVSFGIIPPPMLTGTLAQPMLGGAV